MNGGSNGSGAYNKNVKRKTSSLLLSKTATNGRGSLTTGNAQWNEHREYTGGRVSARGQLQEQVGNAGGRVSARGQLQLQAIPRGSSSAPAGVSQPQPPSQIHRGSGNGRQLNTVSSQPLQWDRQGGSVVQGQAGGSIGGVIHGSGAGQRLHTRGQLSHTGTHERKAQSTVEPQHVESVNSRDFCPMMNCSASRPNAPPSKDVRAGSTQDAQPCVSISRQYVGTSESQPQWQGARHASSQPPRQEQGQRYQAPGQVNMTPSGDGQVNRGALRVTRGRGEGNGFVPLPSQYSRLSQSQGDSRSNLVTSHRSSTAPPAVTSQGANGRSSPRGMVSRGNPAVEYSQRGQHYDQTKRMQSQQEPRGLGTQNNPVEISSCKREPAVFSGDRRDVRQQSTGSGAWKGGSDSQSQQHEQLTISASTQRTAMPSAPSHSSAVSASSATGKGTQARQSQHVDAPASQSEAALRARLAEIEARNKEILARVAELEENNFELAAAMQVIEVEASHRVQKESRALQSELTFRDHQLTLAQKSHTTAMKELSVERGKRKRDRQQAERERAEAAAKSAAAVTAAKADAEERVAAAEKAADILQRRRRARRKHEASSAFDTKDGQPVGQGTGDRALPALADIILSDSSDDVMMLLNATGGVCGAWRGFPGGDSRVGAPDGRDGGPEGYWLRTPSAEQQLRWRHHAGGGDLYSSGPMVPSFASPDADRVHGGRVGDSGRGMNSSSRHSRKHASMRRSPGASTPSRFLAFTPVRARSQVEGGNRLRALADEGPVSAAAARGGRRWGHAGYPGAGPCSAGKNSEVNWVGSPSPLGWWRGEGNGMMGCGQGSWKIASARFLSSQLFTCVMELVEREGCAGDLLDVLTGFLEAIPGETDDELDILSSATRLIHRTLSVVAPAAAAVAAGGMRVDRKVQAAGIEVTTTGAIFGGPRLFAPETTVVSAMDDDFMDGKEQVGQGDRSTGEGNGHENPRIIVVGDEAGDAAREGGSTEQGGTNDPKRQERSDRRSSSGPGQRQVQSPSSCTIFIGGKPVAANDIPTTSPNIFCGRQPRSRGEVRTGRAWWVGTRGEDELGRRLKSSLVGVFHRGAMWASPSLVEASLQAIRSAVWDADEDELAAWGSLLDGDSFQEVMFSDHFRSAWELGAQVLSVLIRNARLFQRLVSTEDYEVPSCGGEASGERGGDGVVGVSASKSVTTVVTEATAPPSPPSRISKDSKHRRLGGGGGGSGDGNRGGGSEEGGERLEGGNKEECEQPLSGDSFLRRLCLDAVSAGEDTFFGTNVGLRLSVIRLVFSGCRRYGANAARSMFGRDASGGSDGEFVGEGLIPTLVNFVRSELDDWERRKYAQTNPTVTGRVRLLKEAFQLLWALAIHAPLPLRDMAQGASVFNTMVSVVSRFYNSLDMEDFQVHKEAMMLMELMN